MSLNKYPPAHYLTHLSLCGILGIVTELFAACLLYFVLIPFQDVAVQYQGQIADKLNDGIESFMAVVVVSPLIEETIYRFLILGIGERFMDFAPANVIQALLFGILHLNPVQSIYAFLLGLLIGVLKKYSGTVAACIVFHLTFNLTGYLSDRYLPGEMSVYTRCIVMLISLAAGVYVFMMIRRKRCEQRTV